MKQAARYTVDRPMLLMHTVNAYETKDEIIFDTINTENGQLGEIYTLENLRKMGDDLLELYDYLTPLSQPLRINIPLPDTHGRPGRLRRGLLCLASVVFFPQHIN